MIIFWSLVLVSISLTAVALQKTYKHLPPKELKKRARDGDDLAKALYLAAAYGTGMDLLLWLVVGLSAAGFILLLGREFPIWLAFMAVVSLLWVAFAWLPRAKPSSISLFLARISAPVVAWVLSKIYPLLSRVNWFFGTQPSKAHTGLFDKNDLLELLKSQKVQADNRIDAAELNIVENALQFGDKLVRDVMTPKRVTKFVKESDSIGPVLLDELHKSGFSRFPVQGAAPDQIVGTLYLHDLADKGVNGTVHDLMSKQVFYVQEEQKLWHALNAFLKTKHHLFIVVNNFEEIVGVLSIEDVLEQIIGKEIVDEFDRYEDLRAVAKMQADKERASSEKHLLE